MLERKLRLAARGIVRGLPPFLFPRQLTLLSRGCVPRTRHGAHR